MGTEPNLIDHLLDSLDVAAEVVERARSRAQEHGGDVLSQLLVMDAVAEQDVLEGLATIYDGQSVDVDDYANVERSAFETVDAELMRRLQIIPFRKHRHSLAAFVVDPIDDDAVEEIADTYQVTLSQYVWPRLRYEEALHSLLDEPLADWVRPFLARSEARVSFSGFDPPPAEPSDNAAADSDNQLEQLGQGWSATQALDFIEACYDRDALLHTLLGFAGLWADSRMVLVLGHEFAKPYLATGWPELPDEYRDRSALRGVAIDVPGDSVLFDEEQVGHTIAEMPEDVGLGQLFVELTLFPPDQLLVQTVRIGSRPSMALIGEPLPAGERPPIAALEEVARAVGEQLEQIVVLSKSDELPPPDERIPAAPEPDEDDDAQHAAMPGLASASSSFGEDDQGTDNPSATAYGIPFADEDNGGSAARSAVEVSSPGIDDDSNVSIIAPMNVDDDDDDTNDEPPPALDEGDPRRTMNGGFTVDQFHRPDPDHASEASDVSEVSEQSDAVTSEAEDSGDAPAGGGERGAQATAPMAQIVRPISLKNGRKPKMARETSDETPAGEPDDDEADDVSLEDIPGAAIEPLDPSEASDISSVAEDTEQAEQAPADDNPGAANSVVDEALEEMLDSLDSSDPKEAFTAAEQIAELGTPGLEALAERFPGRPRVDRYQYPIETLPPIQEHGPVLAALAGAGEAAVPVAHSYLDHTSVELRFYATYLFTQLSVDEALEGFIPRLFDRDHQTREIAKQVVLAGRDRAWFDHTVLPTLRDELTAGTEDLRVEVAAEILGEARDHQSVELLIGGLQRYEGRVLEQINAALRAITYKDFVPSFAEWKNWWADAADQSRFDWIIAALNSNSDEIRQMVFGEIELIDDLDLNYHPDQPPKLRGRAQQQMREWLDQDK